MNPASNSTEIPVSTVFHKLATFSVITPLAAVFLQAAFGGITRSVGGAAEFAFGIFQALLCLIGFVAAVISLYGIRAYGTKRILWKAVVGICVPAALWVSASIFAQSLQR